MSDTERVWPVAVNGVYPDDGAEVIRMGEPDVEPNVEIRVLQVGPKAWVATVRTREDGFEHVGRFGLLEAKRTRSEAIARAARVGWLAFDGEDEPGAEAIRQWFAEQRDLHWSEAV